MMDQFKLMSKLTPALRKGKLDECIERTASELKKSPLTPFHRILDIDFTNEPEKVASYFTKMLRAASKSLKIKAIYTEMNGFSINPDKWHFSAFVYAEHGGKKDFDWLSEWDGDAGKSLTLTGMKELQKVYDSDAPEEYEDAKNICDLMVVLKFQNLIRRSAPLIGNLMCPLLATAHDYDFIYEYCPGNVYA